MMKNFNLIYRFYQLFKNKPSVPRWIIFLFDLIICSCALFFSYWVRFNLDLDAAREYGFTIPILIVTVLNIIFFRIFRTYAGVIRLSSAQEGLRCVSAVFCSAFALLISVAVSAMLGLPYLVPTSVLIIYFFTASFSLFAYRIWVKLLYHMRLKGKFIVENVLIFGKTINGTFLKSAIESISDRHYKVVGFIEENQNLWGKSIDNVNFYSFTEAKNIAIKHNVKYIFMTANDPDIEMKNKIVDYCLSRNISVKVIPIVQKWIQGQLQKNQLKDLKIEDLLSRPDIKLPSEHLQEYLISKTILITGAAGSIGSEIAKQLVGINVKSLILCDNRETALYELQYQLQKINSRKDITIACISDVRSQGVMQGLFETYNPQLVFHAAAYKHVPLMEIHPCEAITNNVLGTKIVADLSVRFKVERFVLISTDKAINPTNVMGASKRIAEMYLGKLHSNQNQIDKILNHDYAGMRQEDAVFIKGHTKFIITRFGNVLGSSGSVIPRFQKQLDDGGPITVTHPNIIRYFMTIPEACSLVLEACRMGNGGEIFVFDMGAPVKIVDLANKMIRLSGLTPGKDIQIEFTGLRPGEKLFEELLSKSEEVIPTHHEKLMISKVNKRELNTIFRNVAQLIEIAKTNDNISVVKKMKAIVVEYKSKNSAYERLDVADRPEMVAQ